MKQAIKKSMFEIKTEDFTRGFTSKNNAVWCQCCNLEQSMNIRHETLG